MAGKSLLPAGYADLLAQLKERVRSARIRAVLATNCELLALYWDIGRAIVEEQKRRGWGAKILDLLAADLRREFPDMAGMSRTNVYRMRAFYLAWDAFAKVVPQRVGLSPHPIIPQVVGQLPWGHNIILLEKLGQPADRLWYARAALEHGWSRSVLALQIETRLHERQGKAVTNFATTLPAPQSDLAQQTLKDPYVFEFLTLDAAAPERELELGLLLCKEKDRLIVEYALRDVKKAIGVAECRTRLVESLPKKLQSSLPTVAQIEAELTGDLRFGKPRKRKQRARNGGGA